MTETEDRSFQYYDILMSKLKARIENRPSESIVITGPFQSILPPPEPRWHYNLVHRHFDGIETIYTNIIRLTLTDAQHLYVRHNVQHLYGHAINGH